MPGMKNIGIKLNNDKIYITRDNIKLWQEAQPTENDIEAIQQIITHLREISLKMPDDRNDGMRFANQDTIKNDKDDTNNSAVTISNNITTGNGDKADRNRNMSSHASKLTSKSAKKSSIMHVDEVSLDKISIPAEIKLSMNENKTGFGSINAINIEPFVVAQEKEDEEEGFVRLKETPKIERVEVSQGRRTRKKTVSIEEKTKNLSINEYNNREIDKHKDFEIKTGGHSPGESNRKDFNYKLERNLNSYRDTKNSVDSEDLILDSISDIQEINSDQMKEVSCIIEENSEDNEMEDLEDISELDEEKLKKKQVDNTRRFGPIGDDKNKEHKNSNKLKVMMDVSKNELEEDEREGLSFQDRINTEKESYKMDEKETKDLSSVERNTNKYSLPVRNINKIERYLTKAEGSILQGNKDFNIYSTLKLRFEKMHKNVDCYPRRFIRYIEKFNNENVHLLIEDEYFYMAVNAKKRETAYQMPFRRGMKRYEEMSVLPENVLTNIMIETKKDLHKELENISTSGEKNKAKKNKIVELLRKNKQKEKKRFKATTEKQKERGLTEEELLRSTLFVKCDVEDDELPEWFDSANFKD